MPERLMAADSSSVRRSSVIWSCEGRDMQAQRARRLCHHGMNRAVNSFSVITW